MQSLFGLELTTAQKVIVASVVILVLLALLGLFVRQIQGGRLRMRGQAGGRQRQPRLGIVDTYDLDRQRQLVLIRRDNVEHLIMLGGASDVVVETNILRSGARATAPSYSEGAAPDRPLPPFETLVPPSEPALRAGDEIRRGAAVSASPDVLPPLPTRHSHTHAEAATAASAGVAAALGLEEVGTAAAPAPVAPAPVPPVPTPMPPMTTGPAPSFPREHAPAPAVSADELDDMTKQLEAALKRPFSAVRPANLPPEPQVEAVVAPPKPVAPAPVAPATSREPIASPFKPVEPPRTMEPPKPAGPFAPADRVKPAEPAKAQPAPDAPAAPSTPASVATSMEAELEAALGLKPARVPPAHAEPKPPQASLAAEKPAAEKTASEKPASEKPAPVVGPVEPEPSVTVAEPAQPKQAEAPEPQKPAEAAKEPEPAKEIDPFSVDAIEAEFARLLGRDPKAKS